MSDIGRLLRIKEEAKKKAAENVVDKSTAAVDKTTAIEPESGQQDNKSTADENVVDRKQRDWSTTDRQRSSHSKSVESFRTDEAFRQKIKVFCARQGIDKQDFYRMAVDHYFECAVDRKGAGAVNKTTIDDRREKSLFKTKPLIINLYLAYNPENKWKFHDDEAGAKYNETDIRMIELGIIETQFNAGFKKIRSFKYYEDEINGYIAQDLKSEMLDFLVGHYRGKYKTATGKEVK